MVIACFSITTTSSTSTPSDFALPPIASPPPNIDEAIICTAKLKQPSTTSASSTKISQQINSPPVQLLKKPKENVKVTKRSREHKNETKTTIPIPKKQKTTSSTRNNINKQKIKTVCPNAKHHKTFSTCGLDEESNVTQLNENGCLHETKCCKCDNAIVHKLTSAGHETLFNTRHPVHACEYFKGLKDVICSYCVCYMCFISNKTDESNSSAGNRNLRDSNQRKSRRITK